jgi:hypothetical protein
MKNKLLITGIAVAVLLFMAGFLALPKIVDLVKQTSPSNQSHCVVAPGEWEPARGECPGTTVEMRTKCNNFCEKHPECCGERNENAGGAFSGREEILPPPTNKVVSKLKRNYPATIKALNEGPNIYVREGKTEILSDEALQGIKSIGFNTVQVLLIGKKENGKLVFNDVNNAVLLNDIVAVKSNGLAVWVALDFAGPPDAKTALGEYDELKSSFLDFTKISAELMEKYKVEYLTVNNELDRPFKEQKQWSAEEINNHLADLMPTANAVARREFNGKLINKITQTQNHAKKVLDASFQNVDIAGVDVGPPMNQKMSLSMYQAKFNEYQYYASLAEKAGVSWMNAEYWQGDFDSDYDNFVKNHELTYAQISFDAYLQTVPKGVGYVWNDIRTLSLPQGEATKQALKIFFDRI